MAAPSERTMLARLGRLLDPGRTGARDELRSLARELEQSRKDDATRVGEVLGRLASLEDAAAVARRDVTAHRNALARMRHLLVRQRDLLGRVVRRAGVDQRAIDAEARVTERLTRMSRSPWPIVVGPWTGEVGFELLYWIPFLQWVRETFPIDPDRLIVVSRGGVRAWYGHIASHYEDIFSTTTPDAFRLATVERKKQQRIRGFDREVVRQVMRARGVRRAHLLHPTLMYALFNAYWRYTATVKQVETFTRFRPLPAIDASTVDDARLPDRFTAVRFYFSECFPDTPGNRAFAARIVDGLATQGHVVLLNSDLTVDDHRDFSPSHRERVHVLGTRMRPETNLAVQTAAIGRASAFVGTYGGYSYLAPLYGVNSVAFYSRPAFKQHHLELAHRAFLRLGPARLTPVDTRQAEPLAAALSGLIVRETSA